MKSRFFGRFLASIGMCFLIAACATTPQAPPGPDPEHVAAAKRFLHSWGAGEFALLVFQDELEKQSKDQPGMTELVHKIFSDVTAEHFEDICALTYARHLSREHLTALAQFTESRTGNRFFRAAIAGAMNPSGRKVDGAELMRQFNASEIVEILKFGQSDAFVAMQKALPDINRELREEGRRLGQMKVREYLKRS